MIELQSLMKHKSVFPIVKNSFQYRQRDRILQLVDIVSDTGYIKPTKSEQYAVHALTKAWKD